jgi:hypothetical protein
VRLAAERSRDVAGLVLTQPLLAPVADRPMQVMWERMIDRGINYALRSVADLVFSNRSEAEREDFAPSLEGHVDAEVLLAMGLARAALAGGLVVARAHLGSRGEVPGCRENGHVTAGLGDDPSAALAPDAGDVHSNSTAGAKGPSCSSIAAIARRSPRRGNRCARGSARRSASARCRSGRRAPLAAWGSSCATGRERGRRARPDRWCPRRARRAPHGRTSSTTSAKDAYAPPRVTGAGRPASSRRLHGG